MFIKILTMFESKNEVQEFSEIWDGLKLLNIIFK